MRSNPVALIVAVLAGGIASRSAFATPRVPRADLRELAQPPAILDLGGSRRELAAPDPLTVLGELAGFEKKMQFTGTCPMGTADECAAGGVIEVSSGPGNAIIQSDNTQEAIWDWSFYRSHGGQDNYDGQAALAFSYLALHPGWLEWQDGGGSAPDYYSVYNCGWGVRAVLEFEQSHPGDTSHHDYGVQCAKHLEENALAVAKSSNSLIDQATAAWGASGLWLWADATSNAAQKQSAAAAGAQVKAWLDGAPSHAAFTTWAASGGAVFYGVVNSYMKEHPGELLPWVQSMAPRLGGWIDESMPFQEVPGAGKEWTDWRNAWSAWNMLAQFTAARVLGGGGGDAHRAVAMDIYGKLIAQDTEMDGAIPGSILRPPTEDQSWISSYLAYFGIRELLLLAPAMPDAGSTPLDAGVASDLAAPVAPLPAKSGCAIAARRSPPPLLAFLLLAALRARGKRRPAI